MKSRNEVMVGTVILLGIVLILFGTIWMKGLKFGAEEHTVRAHTSITSSHQCRDRSQSRYHHEEGKLEQQGERSGDTQADAHTHTHT